MSERIKFIAAYLEEEETISDLCDEFGISRKTGYKWIARYERGGVHSLTDLSRAPHLHPNRVPDDTIDKILAVREKHPRWGPKKLLAVVARKEPELVLPAPSTVGEWLRKRALVKPRRRRRVSVPYADRLSDYTNPNDLWCADFKGHFATGEERCHPLTITDSFSRYLLMCHGQRRPLYKLTQAAFERAFREYGLPLTIFGLAMQLLTVGKVAPVRHDEPIIVAASALGEPLTEFAPDSVNKYNLAYYQCRKAFADLPTLYTSNELIGRSFGLRIADIRFRAGMLRALEVGAGPNALTRWGYVADCLRGDQTIHLTLTDLAAEILPTRAHSNPRIVWSTDCLDLTKAIEPCPDRKRHDILVATNSFDSIWLRGDMAAVKADGKWFSRFYRILLPDTHPHRDAMRAAFIKRID